MDKSSSQKINKELAVLKYTLDQMYLIYGFRAIHPKEVEIHSFQMQMGNIF